MDDAAGTPPIGVAAAAALLAGTLACLALPGLPPWPLSAALCATGIGLWLGRGAVVAGMLLLGLGLAGLHAASTLAQQLPLALEHREARVVGTVADLPVHEPRRTRFMLRVDVDDSQPAALRGKLLQLAWHDPHDQVEAARRPRLALAAGSRWRATVKLRAPRGLRNPGGADSERFALMNRIAATGHVRDPSMARQLRQAAGLGAWRERMSRRIDAAVPRASSRFVRALALGDTRALSESDWESLRASGLTHLIAISGFHVGLVAGFAALLVAAGWRCLPGLGQWLPRPQAAAVGALLGAATYAAVAGFALPTVRTVLMVAVVVAARLSRRGQRAVDALSLSVVAVLLVDPLAMLGAGFWLSFAGVAWLLWCLPPSQPRPPLLRTFASAQGVATVGLLPLGVALFGQASLAGPLANLVAIPWWSLVVVPLALVGTGLESVASGCGAWAWRLAAAAFDPSWTFFQYLSGSVLALWWLPEARWFALPMALAGAFWLLLPRGVPGKGLALLLWLPLLWPQRQLPRHGEAELLMLDVGQGLSMVVRTARHALLFDTGPAVLDGFDAGERVVVPALRALGVSRLDAAVVSHADNDHAGGLDAVRRVLSPAVVLAPQGAPVPGASACLAGMHWDWDGVRFRFLHPPVHFPYFGNESSCVLRIETAHGAILLTGDIGAVVERELARREPDAVRADVIQVAHHGSKGSSDPMLVAASGARIALVAAGYGNRFGHPHPATVDRWRRAAGRVLDTREGGALRVRLQAGGLSASGRRDSHRRLWDALQRRGRAAQLSYPPD